ncbi:M48 family metallopeptidase [Pseudodonghicola flavimaris]|uniref:M48 family metallopeptidase n=1 Tax=Pseudodonghicola flavimaris TaxID=3050036 RepID=A0ABT7EYT3_9RHOB|nr:M48 family metallopeptidase [Pseudodonghicola flavimaris]MDK3017501.1 M48 family metallopeptidase [Pseudodonghicola flavimaris]
MRRMFSLVALLLVAACDTISQGPGAAPELTPQDEVRLQHFAQVIKAVEPVAERECQSHAIASNCSFLIQVDTDREMGPNAFQSIDGRGRPVITFTLALIETVDNEDQMAFVLSHETAHHILGHLQRQTENARAGAQILGGMARRDGASPQVIMQAQEIGAELGARSFSKEFELEADHLGAIIAFEAGYDPRKGADYFDALPDPGDQPLGTHPPNAERKRLVDDLVRQLEAGV